MKLRRDTLLKAFLGVLVFVALGAVIAAAVVVGVDALGSSDSKRAHQRPRRQGRNRRAYRRGQGKTLSRRRTPGIHLRPYGGKTRVFGPSTHPSRRRPP
jgi:hypothetical protein